MKWFDKLTRRSDQNNVDTKISLDAHDAGTSLNLHHQSVKTHWRESVVHKEHEHFQILYGDELDNCTVAAYVGQHENGCFPVHFVSTTKHKIFSFNTMAAQVKIEIDYYLKTLPDECKLDAKGVWDYQKYHCSTAANLYGKTHWRFINSNNSIVNDKSVSGFEQSSMVSPYQKGYHGFIGFVLTLFASASNEVPVLQWGLASLGLLGFIRYRRWSKQITSKVKYIFAFLFSSVYMFFLVLLLIDLLFSLIKSL